MQKQYIDVTFGTINRAHVFKARVADHMNEAVIASVHGVKLRVSTYSARESLDSLIAIGLIDPTQDSYCLVEPVD